MRARVRNSEHAGPLLLLALVVCAVLWPAVRHLTTRPLIGTDDSSVFYWAWWHLPRELGSGRSPFETEQIFHPVGADLSLTTTVPSVALLTWPIRAVLGPAAQINLVQLGAAFGAAAATYLLTHRLCRDRGASLVAALVFAFGSFRFVQMEDHLNLIHTGFLPAGALAALLVLDRPLPGRALLLGAVLGAAFLTDPQIAVFTGAVVAVICAIRWHDVRAAWRTLGLAGVSAVAVSLPLLVPMVRAIATGEADAGTGAAQDVRIYSASPLSWLVPPPTHRIVGDLVADLQPAVNIETIVYPGLVALAVVVIGWRRVPAAARLPWLVLAAAGFVLSLGPRLVHDGRDLGVPMPFAVLEHVPGLDMIRAPGRFSIVAGLGLGVLVGLALSHLLAGVAPRRRLFVLAAVAAAVLIDLVPTTMAQRSDEVPAPYHAISEHAGGGAVLELPLQWATGFQLVGDRDAYHSVQMERATVHGRPLASGSVSRLSDERLDRLRSIPLYAALLRLQDGAAGEEITLADLHSAGIGYVVHDRATPLPAAREAVEALDLEVLADDGQVTVWVVPPPAG